MLKALSLLLKPKSANPICTTHVSLSRGARGGSEGREYLYMAQYAISYLTWGELNRSRDDIPNLQSFAALALNLYELRHGPQNVQREREEKIVEDLNRAGASRGMEIRENVVTTP